MVSLHDRGTSNQNSTYTSIGKTISLVIHDESFIARQGFSGADELQSAGRRLRGCGAGQKAAIETDTLKWSGNLGKGYC
jgi:hypothetical protein